MIACVALPALGFVIVSLFAGVAVLAAIACMITFYHLRRFVPFFVTMPWLAPHLGQ